MAILLGFYHLLLEREKMHRFNRFYLMAALAFSLAMPFISLPVANEALVQTINLLPLQLGNEQIADKGQAFLPEVLILIYVVVAVILAIRFAVNITAFVKKIKANEKAGLGTAKLILLDEDVLPHTFLSYIFINKAEYNSDSIENELYAHELTHVNQKHTLDILFVEVLKVVFWFNPLVYLYKKAIQLNHEFLADEYVVTETGNAIPYQNLLLSKASHSYSIALASNLNFSITKKRFIMMTKNTSRLQAFARQVAVLPVIATLFLISCSDSTTSTDAGVTSQDNSIHEFGTLEQQPEYPGGMEAFYREVMTNFITPKVPHDMTAKVYVSFTIEKDGTMTDIKAKGEQVDRLVTEAERVLKSITTKWTPGKKDGKPVRVSLLLPIQVNIKA